MWSTKSSKTTFIWLLALPNTLLCEKMNFCLSQSVGTTATDMTATSTFGLLNKISMTGDWFQKSWVATSTDLVYSCCIISNHKDLMSIFSSLKLYIACPIERKKLRFHLIKVLIKILHKLWFYFFLLVLLCWLAILCKWWPFDRNLFIYFKKKCLKQKINHF